MTTEEIKSLIKDKKTHGEALKYCEEHGTPQDCQIVTEFFMTKLLKTMSDWGLSYMTDRMKVSVEYKPMTP